MTVLLSLDHEYMAHGLTLIVLDVWLQESCVLPFYNVLRIGHCKDSTVVTTLLSWNVRHVDPIPMARVYPVKIIALVTYPGHLQEDKAFINK